jgi:integrase
MAEIKVYVIQEGDRKNLTMRFRDPVTGRHVKRSAGTRNQREAEKAAAKWEAELNEGRYQPASRLTWDAFRKRYEEEYASALAPGTRRRIAAVFNSVEEVLNPKRLRELTADRLSQYRVRLKAKGKADATIGIHFAHLKAALRWAARVGMLPKAPDIEAKRPNKMKGRAIGLEEFERMLGAVPKVLTVPVGPGSRERQPAGLEILESWRYLLRGLWLSGLRLGEALELTWDRRDRPCVDLEGRRPRLWFPGTQKSKKYQFSPMAPEFAQVLLATPEAKRRGRVFRPLPLRGESPVTTERAMKTISAIGEKAGVKVGEDKYASAHDLRRAFGRRWSKRVMPPVLKELMRHGNIATTMTYYVGADADDAAEVLWAAVGTILGTSVEIEGNQATREANVSDDE